MINFFFYRILSTTIGKTEEVINNDNLLMYDSRSTRQFYRIRNPSNLDHGHQY